MCDKRSLTTLLLAACFSYRFNTVNQVTAQQKFGGPHRTVAPLTQDDRERNQLSDGQLRLLLHFWRIGGPPNN